MHYRQIHTLNPPPRRNSRGWWRPNYSFWSTAGVTEQKKTDRYQRVPGTKGGSSDKLFGEPHEVSPTRRTLQSINQSINQSIKQPGLKSIIPATRTHPELRVLNSFQRPELISTPNLLAHVSVSQQKYTIVTRIHKGLHLCRR